jgi:membrane-associated protease RseP (regulator of RpoE activity)
MTLPALKENNDSATINIVIFPAFNYTIFLTSTSSPRMLLAACAAAVSNSLDKRPDVDSKHVVSLHVSCQVSSTSSYGFTVRGSDETDCRRPIGIASVRPHGPAAEAGLLPGDQLVAVNGLDVTGCSAASVSIIIRRTALTSGSVTLGVVRTGCRHFDGTDDGSTLHLQDTGYHTLQQSRDLTGNSKQLPEDEVSLSVDVSDDRPEDGNSSTLKRCETGITHLRCPR